MYFNPVGFMPSIMMVQSLPLVQKTISMPPNKPTTKKSAPASNPEDQQDPRHPTTEENNDAIEAEEDNELLAPCKPEITKEQIEAELSSVAVEWKPLRNCYECACGSPLEGTVNKKTHCQKCGNVFCKRCVRTKLELPGHFSKKLVPVCNACHKLLIGDQRASQSMMQATAEATL